MKNQTPNFQPEICLDCKFIKGVNCPVWDKDAQLSMDYHQCSYKEVK